MNSFSTLETLALHDADRLDALPPALDLSRFQIVHDGTDCPHLPSPPPQHDAPLIGLVGRISRWKGQHIFLQAAAKVRQRFPAARFQIIGAPLFSEENYQREIHALANKLGLDDCVDFTGFRSDVPQLIANLDLLVHASISGEPFGQVVIEGMAAAKPIVATRAGGIPEIVLEGETGLLVPPGNVDAMAEAIIRLLGDSAAAAEMGRRGHRRVRDFFTIERTTAGVQSVFQSLLGSSPSPIDSRRDAPSALLAHSRAG